MHTSLRAELIVQQTGGRILTTRGVETRVKMIGGCVLFSVTNLKKKQWYFGMRLLLTET